MMRRTDQNTRMTEIKDGGIRMMKARLNKYRRKRDRNGDHDTQVRPQYCQQKNQAKTKIDPGTTWHWSE